MNRLVPSRFTIELTLIELDEWNEPVAEHTQPPLTLYGATAVRAWLDILPDLVARAEKELGGAARGTNNEVPTALPRAE